MVSRVVHLYEGNQLFYHVITKMSHDFFGWHIFLPLYTLVQLIAMVQMYHLKSHGTLYHGSTVVKFCTVFGVVHFHHDITTVQLITMVQLYHPKNHDTFCHGITKICPGFWGSTFVPR
jgi:hypothetical protein